ncbi:hypothetical protein V1477_021065 [Vespula maculifrons]|uniref:Uncharacterized protein n=1 Tax=Vespula maculifrons TaxID=7453 RepID=A0ABD2AH31_VESMC
MILSESISLLMEDTRILTTLNLILKYETSKEKHIYLIFLFFCTSDNKSYMDNTNVRPSTRSRYQNILLLSLIFKR